jgi:hypothetical protein
VSVKGLQSKACKSALSPTNHAVRASDLRSAGHRCQAVRTGLRGSAGVLRENAVLLKRINVIWVVQSPSQKYSRSLPTQITCISLAIPAHTEGRFAIVTDVGLGCDGRGRRQRRGRYLRTAKSCGPDAPTLASSVAEGDVGPNGPDTPVSARRRWQESPVTGESAK